MIAVKSRYSNFKAPLLYKKYFWASLSEFELKAIFVRICAQEQRRDKLQGRGYWVKTRFDLIKYVEEKYGLAPAILKMRRMPRDPFILSMDKEYRKWLGNP